MWNWGFQFHLCFQAHSFSLKTPFWALLIWRKPANLRKHYEGGRIHRRAELSGAPSGPTSQTAQRSILLYTLFLRVLSATCHQRFLMALCHDPWVLLTLLDMHFPLLYLLNFLAVAKNFSPLIEQIPKVSRLDSFSKALSPADFQDLRVSITCWDILSEQRQSEILPKKNSDASKWDNNHFFLSCCNNFLPACRRKKDISFGCIQWGLFLLVIQSFFLREV